MIDKLQKRRANEEVKKFVDYLLLCVLRKELPFSSPFKTFDFIEPVEGFEPPTLALQVRRSTPELHRLSLFQECQIWIQNLRPT